MKYLETYKLFENRSEDSIEDAQTISEILLDLHDIGYYTSVVASPLDLAHNKAYPDIIITIKDYERRPTFYQKINRGRGNEKRNIELEQETKLRIIDYMKSRGYKVSESHVSWEKGDKTVYTEDPSDLYRNVKKPLKSITDYALYILFFPQETSRSNTTWIDLKNQGKTLLEILYTRILVALK